MDSAQGIAAELVAAGLVDGKDVVVIAANLKKLIESAGQLRTVTFSLVSHILHCYIVQFHRRRHDFNPNSEIHV